MIKDEESIKTLEESWTQPGGFLFELTEGRYELTAGEAFIARLHEIKCPQGKMISRRLVNVLWQIPSYLSDRRADVLENGGDVQGGLWKLHFTYFSFDPLTPQELQDVTKSMQPLIH